MLFIVFVSGLIYFFISGIIAVATGITAFVSLRLIKEGRPQGYCFELLYRSRIVNYFPFFIRTPFIFMLKPQFEKKIILSPISSDEEFSDRYVVFWHGEKRVFK